MEIEIYFSFLLFYSEMVKSVISAWLWGFSRKYEMEEAMARILILGNQTFETSKLKCSYEKHISSV